MALETTWTANDAVAFTAGTLASISDCITQVQDNVQRGTLTETTTPSTTQVQNWLIRGKQELCEQYGFTWKRRFVYADTAAGTYRYALPADFGGYNTTLRNLTSDEVLTLYDSKTFDVAFPDPSGQNNAEPVYYTIKDRELWLSKPADAVYRFELEYQRVGDDSTSTDVSYLPELMRFRITDFATYKAYLMLQQWDAANLYKADWMGGVHQTKQADGRKKWSSIGYTTRNFFYK